MERTKNFWKNDVSLDLDMCLEIFRYDGCYNKEQYKSKPKRKNMY